MGVNVVHLIGNLGHDPELRATQSGTAVLNLRLAVNERRKGPDGEWSDAVEWVNVTTWGRTAENVAKYMAKGSQIYVDGSLRTRDWTDKEGNTRRSTEVVARNVRFLGGKSNSSSQASGYGNSSNGGYGESRGYSSESAVAATPDSDDIPF